MRRPSNGQTNGSAGEGPKLCLHAFEGNKRSTTKGGRGTGTDCILFLVAHQQIYVSQYQMMHSAIQAW